MTNIDLADESNWNELARARSREFAARLRTMARSSQPRMVRQAVEHLAWIGFDEDISRLTQTMIKGPTHSSVSILRGFSFGAFHKHYSPKSKSAILKAITPILTGRLFAGTAEAQREAREKAVEIADRLHRRAAHALFRSEACLHPRNPTVREILWHFVNEIEEGAPIKPLDPRLLWPIYDAVVAGTLRTGGGYEPQVRAQILFLAAELDPDRTRREAKIAISETKQDKWNQLNHYAKQALRRCKGTLDPHALLQQFTKRPKKFSKEAAAVLCVQELAEHVLNDGLPVYFHNLPEHWPLAMEGLRRLKLTKAASVFRSASRIFGPMGQATNIREARRAFEQLDARAAQKLERLGGAFEAQTDEVLSAVARYIAEQPAKFRSI